MDLDEVSAFVRVVQTGSMNKAATELGVPRSTVSRRLSRLEDRLGVRLLRRTTRKMTLTEEGVAYLERVAPAINAIRDASSAVREFGVAPRGTLKVSIPIDMSLSAMPEIILKYLSKYPEVGIEVDLSNRFVDLVEEGFDLALRAGTLPDSSLVSRRLGTTDFWLFASPEYLKKHSPPSRPEDLVDHECLLMRGNGGKAIWTLEHADGRREAVGVQGRLSAGEFGFLMRAGLSGAGIVMLPSVLTVHHCAQGGLVRVLSPWFVRGGAVSLVTPPGKQMSPKVRAFQDLVISELQLNPKIAEPPKPQQKTRRIDRTSRRH